MKFHHKQKSAPTIEGDCISCPICSDDLSQSDQKYPLLCSLPSCHYNICASCVAQLLESSQAGPSEASDGNIYSLDLKCPNCRGKYIASLPDILCLRDYESNLYLQKINDSELNAADLRKKYGWDDEKMTILNDARRRYELNSDPKNNNRSTDEPSHAVADQDNSKAFDDDNTLLAEKIRFVDNMVFRGLDEGLTEDEQSYLVTLMTSGSVDKLVRGTEMLHGIVEMNARKNVLRNMKQNRIEAAHSADSAGSNKSAGSANALKPAVRPKASQTTPVGRTALRNASRLEMERANHNRWTTLYPLPFRMPRLVNMVIDFNPYHKKPLLRVIDDEDTFSFLDYNQRYNKVDYESRVKIVKDAYTILSFSSKSGKLKKRETTKTIGIENIISAIDMDIDDQLFQDGIPKVEWRRVIVSYADFRLGLHVGDVITHIDGERFDGNAEKLRWMLESRRTQESLEGTPPSVQLVVNAEVGVAEALRLRHFLARSQTEY